MTDTRADSSSGPARTADLETNSVEATSLETLRVELTAAIHAIQVDAAASNFLVRGRSLSDSAPRAITFDQQTTMEVAADVLSYAEAILAKQWLAYDPSYQLASNQALVDELGEVPELGRLHSALQAAPLDSTPPASTPPVSTGPASTPPVSTKDDPLNSHVVATVHRAWKSPTLGLTAYRLKGPGIATRRPRGIRILVPRGGIFERIDTEVVYYEPGFDALVFGDHVFVTSITTLQRSLGSTQRARAMATRTFARATSKLAIEGADELAAAVATDPAMVAKMAQLSRILDNELEYAALLTTDRILAFLDRNPHVPIATTGTGSERRLLFEASPQKRYLIVKALADDYLRSELSQRTYEVGSKVQLPD
ncbi:Kiwa anti-phage protein KwaB-like domain-containing protein [Salinibacterium sp.]|uniref:Kiwa anti-phage protein KwaB-like domain-containing protein n=1 Tax=Salinibacterium sp. TaxID=1915057 RepID=UPI00286A0D85|nr:Kiwa anti-phage protein KwaB-like domain-containing protein [Salinibacterium sp.]